MLDQGAVGIKEQLCVVDRPAIALVDADRHHHPRLLAGLADGEGRVRRYGDRLIEQAVVFLTDFVGRLHEGEIGIVRNHRLREGGELHALAAEGGNLFADLANGALTAVEHGAELNSGGLDHFHV
jgi:hypothetical protein